ncbi:hypothetical protein CIB48_g7302 [Xylaria polymorpha]|nr:hypothetical protein CIB48_g7302 [Xylaria polymorpha]
MDNAKKVTDKIKGFFSTRRSRYEFEKISGQGGSGIALCFRDREAGPDGFPRFIVKAVVLGENREITNEIRWLEKLQWAEHIVTPLKLDPDPVYTLFENPYIIIEYIENGTLEAFLRKRRVAGLGRLPNRVMWAIFLCPCLAMANPPPPINPRAPTEKRSEMLPIDASTRTAGDLIHSDMNLGNLMFGDRLSHSIPRGQPTNTEHRLVPILKLIDFGEAREVTAPETLPRRREYDRKLNLVARMENDLANLQNMGKPPKFRSVGTDMNILEIGVVMGRLITNDLTNPGAGVLRELMDELRDNIAAVPDPSLDSDLFSLVARCLACDPNLRPRLSQLLDLLEYYTANKTYDGVMEESDFSINRMIQTHIFDVGDQGSADDVIALSPDSLAADVSIMSLGGPDNPIVISPDSSVADFSTMNIESQPAQGSANNPVVIYGQGQTFVNYREEV